MPESKKWGGVVLGIIVIVLIALGIWQGTNHQSLTGSIKIGVVTQLTGGVAFIGEGVMNAMLLARENLGKTKYSYELIFEDDQLDPKKTSTAANKLINIDRVDVIVSDSSGSGNVVTPIAERSKVVHIGIASDANIAKGDYNFIHWTPPSEEGGVFVKELQKRNIKKLAMFNLNQQGVAAIAGDLKEKLKGTDISVVTEQMFNFGERDFRSIIMKAKQSKPEIYLLLAFSPELEMLARQIKEVGITTPLTSIESFELTEQVDLFEGEWYVNAAEPTGKFIDQYNKKTGKNPVMGTANAYDVFNLIVAAAEKIESSTKPTTKEIAEELMKINSFTGALGDLSVNEEGIVISKAVVRVIKDGRPVTISD